jgi:DNA-binding Lrp family transcriptional regulator
MGNHSITSESARAACARDLAILDALETESRVSQRKLAERSGISVGFVNRRLQSLIAEGFVRVVDPDVRPFLYRITSAGRRYRLTLIYEHYQNVAGSMLGVEQRVRQRLEFLKKKGVERLVFFGAGQILDFAELWAESAGFQVVGVVDEDESKQGSIRGRRMVQAPAAAAALNPDAIINLTCRRDSEIERAIGAATGGSLIWHL